MGFKIGRSTDAPVLETRKTARYGEQKVVATETPVATEREEEVMAPALPDDGNSELALQPEAEVRPAKAKRGRKARK